MSKRRKTILYISVSGAALIVVLLVMRFIFYIPFTSSLPALPETGSIPDAALEQISLQRKQAKRIPSAEKLGSLGLVFHANALYNEAASCYKLAIQKDGSAWIWRYYLGYLYLEMGQSDKVLEQFSEVIESNPKAYHAYYYAGEASINTGQTAKAEEYFSKIRSIKKNKTSGQAKTRTDHYALGVYASYQLSKIYMNTGRTVQAEKMLREIINTTRNFGPAYRLLGNIYRASKDISLAEQIGATANDLMVYTPPVDTLVDELALLSRSESYLLKMIDEAIKSIYSEWAYTLVNNGVENMPASKYLLSKAISVCLWVGKDLQAVSYANDHLNFSSNDYSELNDIAMLFFDREQYEVSTRYMQKALELKPDDFELMKWLAKSTWLEGDHERALNILDDIIAAHPENYKVLAELTDIMIFDLGEEQKSFENYTLLERVIPSNPKVLKISAWKAEKEGNINKAILKYEASFRGDPEDMTTIENLGNLLISQQMWEKALKHYRSALEVHSDDPKILERMGSLLVLCPEVSLRNIQEGRNYLERAFIHTSGQSLTKIDAGKNLALAYAMSGDKQNAITVINMTIKIAQQAPEGEQFVATLVSFRQQLEKMSDQTVVITE